MVKRRTGCGGPDHIGPLRVKDLEPARTMPWIGGQKMPRLSGEAEVLDDRCQEKRPGCAPGDVRTEYRDIRQAFLKKGIIAGKLQNGVADNTTVIVLPREKAIESGETRRQAEHVCIDPPSPLLPKQQVSKQIGKARDTAFSGAGCIKKNL